MEDFPAPVPVEDRPVPAQADYFGFTGNQRYVLPDGVSYVDIKVMNEGERRKFQNQTNRDVKFHKGGEAAMKLRPGDDRFELLSIAIVGWNLVNNGQPVVFNPRSLAMFLESADPKIIDGIEKAVRLANPWLLAEMSADDIRAEIRDLEDLLEKKLEEEAGNSTSGSK